MKKWFSLLLVVLLIVSVPFQTLAWGPDGHMTIGKLASLFLEANSATNTLNKIKTILRSNESLSSVAIWADTIKGLPTGPTVTNNDPDTQAFLRDPRNKDHRDWHFDDLPLDCASYDACSVAPIKFNSATDVVQMINLCVTTLRSNAPNPRFSKRNALRLLVHLVGDLHQPMHVGSGFINPNGPDDTTVFATDPKLIKQGAFDHDRGGNLLLIEGLNDKNLHSFWDGDLVKASKGSQTITQFAAGLKSSIPTDTAWNGQGQFKNWASQWASDTLKQSRNHAYDIDHNGVTIVDALSVQDIHAEAEAVHFNVKLADGYKDANKEIARVQLVKGGYRLAKLLQAIFP